MLTPAKLAEAQQLLAPLERRDLCSTPNCEGCEHVWKQEQDETNRQLGEWLRNEAAGLLASAEAAIYLERLYQHVERRIVELDKLRHAADDDFSIIHFNGQSCALQNIAHAMAEGTIPDDE